MAGSAAELSAANPRSSQVGLGVTDEPFYSPTHRPPQRQRRAGELQWTVRSDHATWTCELFFRREFVGWEAQIFRDGELVIGRTFILKGAADGWANGEREGLEKVDG